MDELHGAADKFDREADHFQDQLDRLLDPALPVSLEAVELTLAQAKRVRRESTILVRLLASLRDQLRPKEGASTP